MPACEWLSSPTAVSSRRVLAMRFLNKEQQNSGLPTAAPKTLSDLLVFHFQLRKTAGEIEVSVPALGVAVHLGTLNSRPIPENSRSRAVQNQLTASWEPATRPSSR